MSRVNEWLTTIRVKRTFLREPTDGDILESAEVVVRELKRVNKEHSSLIIANALDFDLVIDNFEFIADGIKKQTSFKDFDSLGAWNSWKDVFNEYLAMLYDLAGTRVLVSSVKGLKDGVYNFMWVE